MPLYEFYCEPCHTLFTFRSQRVDTRTLPPCPRCGQALKREVSSFAHSVRGAVAADGASGDDGPERMDRALAQMGDRMQALEDDSADPREAVKVMKALAEAEGLHFNREVREAMARIEAGEDPEKIDEEFSEVFETDNPFAEGADDGECRSVSWLRRLRGPARDPNWHDMPRAGE